MSIKTIKYFSTIIVAVVAVLAGWWLWNYYMQSPWTRDGKIRAEQVSITPQVSGRIVELNIKDNQLVNAGDLLLTIDKTPFQIAELNAQAQLAKAQSDLAKANNEANRRRHLSQNFISAEELDTANLNVKAMQASVDAAQATLKQAQWQLAQTEIRAPVSGWVTNLTTRIGDYADTGKPLFALVDSHSFYVIGYFEETKLRHIREGAPAQITLYSDNKTLLKKPSCAISAKVHQHKLPSIVITKRYRVTFPVSVGRFMIRALKVTQALFRMLNLTSPGFDSPNAFPSALRWIKSQAMSRWCRAPPVALP